MSKSLAIRLDIVPLPEKEEHTVIADRNCSIEDPSLPEPGGPISKAWIARRTIVTRMLLSKNVSQIENLLLRSGFDNNENLTWQRSTAT